MGGPRGCRALKVVWLWGLSILEGGNGPAVWADGGAEKADGAAIGAKVRPR